MREQAQYRDQADANGGDKREKSRSGPMGHAQTKPIGFNGKVEREKQPKGTANDFFFHWGTAGSVPTSEIPLFPPLTKAIMSDSTPTAISGTLRRMAKGPKKQKTNIVVAFIASAILALFA